PMIVAAVYPYSAFPTTRGWAERQTLGTTLAAYARNEGSDIQQFESFADAAKRFVSGGVTARRTPEATARWLNETADAILNAVGDAEATPTSIDDAHRRELGSVMTDARILAYLARFHAHRSGAAVQYDVFTLTRDAGALRNAIDGERAAIESWRKIVAAA